jgi:Ca2+-binding EF-hand superfamily protein
MFWCPASLGWTTGSHFHTGSVSASRSSLPGCSAAATTLIRGTDKLLQAEAIEADAAKRSLVVQTAQSAFMFADMDGSGTIDFAEMNKMMERMLDLKEGCSIAQLDDGEEMPEGCTALEEVQDMFRQYDTDGDGDLSYNEFLLLLADCSIESALFQGLLTFAEDAVQAGVLGKLKAGSSALVDRRSSHILDNGTPAWRESIEAAFDLCDNDRGGKITAEEAIQAVTKYPLIAQLLHVPVELDDEGVKEHMRELCDLINTDGDEGIDREEWIEYFCPAREAVAQASRWEPGSAECSKVTGYIFDCDGTIYQPSGMIPGAEDVLTMLERTGCQYAPLSNADPYPSPNPDPDP